MIDLSEYVEVAPGVGTLLLISMYESVDPSINVASAVVKECHRILRVFGGRNEE